MRLRAGLLVMGAALAGELAAWALGAHNRTETFAFFRVQAQLGAAGFVVAAVVGLLAMVSPRPRLARPYALLAVGALVLHALFLDLPQGQPDTLTWFSLAQRVADTPGVLLDWPAAVWSSPEARFHRPFPLVPGVYGAAYALFGESPATTDAALTLWALLFPLVVAWTGAERGRPALLAGAVAATTPILAAQQGWMLADLPACVLVTFAWGVMVRARGPAGIALAVAACLPALLTKIGATLFLGPPALLLLTRRSPALGFVLIAAGYAALAGLYPPRWRDPSTWVAAIGALALHLRPAVWMVALRRSGADRLALLPLGAVAAVPAVVLWAPAEHAARYALPAVAALAIGAARAAPRMAAFAVGSGLVLLLGGYRPLLVNHQAKNLQVATRDLVAHGVTAIEVWTDMPDTTFSAEGVAAMVDFYAPVPVRIGGTLSAARRERKRHWWEFVEAPPWRGPGPADGVLLGLFGSDDARFLAARPGVREVGRTSLFRASSLVLPREVVTYVACGSCGAPPRR